ncbi:MAG: FecR domain-containing protein [Xanthomonadaceae bacterium]|nr:FecR domain-containing protein [Xanthomonadaceae bacterium]
MNIVRLLFALSFIYSTSVLAEELKNKTARIFSLSGAVKIQSADGKERSAAVAEHLAPGDQIKTALGSSVKLLLADDSVIDLGPGSVFKINEINTDGKLVDRKVDVALEQGTARSVIREKIGSKGFWHLKTKSAVMGVRGTEFVVNTNNSVQKVTVLEGSVAVADTRSVAGLGSGFQPGSSALPLDTQLLTPGQAMQFNAAPDAGGRSVASTNSGVQLLTGTQVTQTTNSAVVKDQTFSQQTSINMESNGGKGSVGTSAMETFGDVAKLTSQSIDIAKNVKDAPPVIPMADAGMMTGNVGSMLATSPLMGGGASVTVNVTISQ